MLKIHNLHASVDGETILKGVDLSVGRGAVHAIMGPNGSGKSTLSNVIAGHDSFEVISGDIVLDGVSILGLEPEERAARGVFLAFQYPTEIPGVTSHTFLRSAINAIRAARELEPMKPPEMMRKIRDGAEKLGINKEMLQRGLNVGFSGGEKKRNEVLQMMLLEPHLAVLDETDSGLDIDALRIVADGVNAMRHPDRSFLVITHYQRLLDYIVPDQVHVMSGGRIVESGGPELAEKLEAEGYGSRVEPVS